VPVRPESTEALTEIETQTGALTTKDSSFVRKAPKL